jgi:hypothetical protein
MQKRTQLDLLSESGSARYAVLRTYRRDGTAVETPMWFAVDAD